MKACNFFWFFYLVLLTIPSHAASKVSLDNLSRQAQEYLRKEVYKLLPQKDHAHVKITSHRLDNRLSLAKCDKPLTFSHKSSSSLKGKVAIKVSCMGSIAWSIYSRHNTSLYKKVAIANAQLRRGHIIQKDDISLLSKDIFTQRLGYIDKPEQIIGKQLKRPLNTGNIIYHEALTMPNIIKKGHSVSIIAKVGSLSVITSGTALSNGKKGDQIKVENTRSSRVIMAKIIGPNTVEIIL